MHAITKPPKKVILEDIKKNLNAMNVITKPPKKVILEDIKKKKFKCNECDHQAIEKSNLRGQQKKR